MGRLFGPGIPEAPIAATLGSSEICVRAGARIQ